MVDMHRWETRPKPGRPPTGGGGGSDGRERAAIGAMAVIPKSGKRPEFSTYGDFAGGR